MAHTRLHDGRGENGQFQAKVSILGRFGKYVSRNWALAALILIFWAARRIGFDNLLYDFLFAIAVAAVLTFGWNQLATDAPSKLKWGMVAAVIVLMISLQIGALLVLLLVPALLFDLFYLSRRS